jgi:hypothetical protein
VTAAEATAVADLEKPIPLATEFEVVCGGALTMALAQEAEPGNPFRECWLAHGRLCVPEARSINRAEILTARADAAAEAAEFAAAEAAAAEASAAAEAAALVEAAAAWSWLTARPRPWRPGPRACAASACTSTSTT